MRIHSILLVSILVVAMAACKPEQKHTPDSGATRLITNLEEVRMRETPGETGKVVKVLPKGTTLYDLGEVSDFTTKVKLRGIEFDEPWLKVRTEDGSSGWVYGGTLHFQMDDATQLANLLIEKRLQTLFGKQMAEKIKSYRSDFQNIKTTADFALVYRKGSTLRDSLIGLLGEKIIVSDPNELPDLFWLKEALPGFVPQLVAEGTAYYLFWDYKKLAEKIKLTTNPSDDEFIDLAITLFPEDSIEYFYPAWFLQTWDYGGSSLLGRGIHLEVIKKMDKMLQKSDEFAPEVTHWKQLLINDITETDVNYWETSDKILAELDRMLSANLNILTVADKVALETRRKQFETPTDFKIQINQQAGSQ